MDLVREHLRSSLWPVPVAMLLGAFVLLQATRAVDAQVSGDEALQIWWLHSGNGDDARNLLSTIVTAIITIASLVFSITIVALSLAANQFGSRLIRAYMRDRRTKLSLGFFLLTVVFSLLALRLVSQDMPASDVPHVTVTTSLVLGILCVLVLVFFLHVVARLMIADEVIRRVAAELDEAIEALPAMDGRAEPRPADEELLPPDFHADSRVLRSRKEGYVQEIHYERLAACAAERQLVLRLDVSAGDYMCRNGWLGSVHPAASCAEDVLAALHQAVQIGPERTPVQDLAFPVRHLVDIALRALSPGINEANTALVVIDRVRGALARLLESELPSGVFRDEAGTCRVLGHRRSHRQAFAAALHPIRDAAAPQPLVLLSILQALAKLTEHVRDPQHADLIREEARLVVETSRLHPMLESEARAIARAHEQVEQRAGTARAKAAGGTVE
jgi:uncharacterized membrane protein